MWFITRWSQWMVIVISLRQIHVECAFDFYYDENLCIGEYGIPFMPSLPGLDQTQSQAKTSQTSKHLEADMSS